MNFTEWIFLIQFLGLLTITGFFFYKVMGIGLSSVNGKRNTGYDVISAFKADFILFALMLIAYAVGRMAFLISAGYGSATELTLLFAGLMNIENIALSLGFIFFLISIFYNIKEMITQPIKAHQPENRKLSGYN